MSKCSGITRSGERCRGVAIDGSGLCYAHSPDHADARRRAASKGGRTGGKGRSKVRMEATHRLCDHLLAGLLRGTIEPPIVAVGVQVLNLKVRATLADVKIRESEELEAEVERLSAALGEQDRGIRYGA